MSVHNDENDVIWADSLDDFKPDYVPVKCWSVLQFFTLRGRTTTLIKENLEYMRYTYYCVYSPSDKRFYKRLGRKYEIDEVYFYLSGDVAVDSLHRFIGDKNLTLLLTPSQVESVSECLKRLYKAYFNVEGKLDYRLYIQILDISLKLEDFRNNQKNITGYKTAINLMEGQIRDLWAKASLLKK
jgi:hypothetical protein